MRYRKGSRGLYYNEDGKLSNCQYNMYRLNPIELYGAVWRNSDYIGRTIEVFRYLGYWIISTVMIPFLGFISWIDSRIQLRHESDKTKENVKKKFSKDYYEEIN